MSQIKLGSAPVSAGHEPDEWYQEGSVEYVGEGAANVVVDWVLPDGRSMGRLLRMPKAGTSSYSYEELQDYWTRQIVPLFQEDDLVHQTLGPPLVLNVVCLAQDINDMLERMDQEDKRGKFRGSRVVVGVQPMRLMDLRAREDFDLAFDFKPKWLVQSRSAPDNATRCRNCAHEVYKLHKAGNTGPVTKLCPLKYTSGPSDIEEAVQHIWHQMSLRLRPPQPSLDEPLLRESLVRWLKGPNVLRRLQTRQLQLDSDGPLHAEDTNVGFHLAMTLRDCSCYIRLSSRRPGKVEARLGDLDRKNAEAKMEYWRNTEKTLIEGGFYEEKEEPRIATNCVYGR
ncbi:hypothetical protein DL546_002225 [Coniochaeta pulveracea]|uniref:Inositol-pentakisphosphate 2-kinase n=1 Tax=Coniochaeta pulveracea TaxID=177199 RepID=A0A420XXD8_9PEZI|nr:hypothetical protein DL546_002225 [Coniochaeta pulveracea]